MNSKEIIKEYLKGLEIGSYENIIKLFTEDATIHSPLYGKINAKAFYQDLFKDTSKSKITLRNIFTNPENKEVVAGHFRYDWILRDGTSTFFECVDVFRLNDKGKIKELTIIYDTAKIRNSFEDLKK